MAVLTWDEEERRIRAMTRRVRGLPWNKTSVLNRNDMEGRTGRIANMRPVRLSPESRLRMEIEEQQWDERMSRVCLRAPAVASLWLIIWCLTTHLL